MTVFVLTEEVEIIGVFKSREAAENTAHELELFNFTIEEFPVKN